MKEGTPTMKLSEKVAYLKGLEEGLNLDSAKAETKLIKGIIDAFSEIVEAIDVNTTDIQEMTERVDEIDMDLGDLEAILFEGFEVEELTEEDLADYEDDDEAFAVVYSSDDEPVDEVEEVVDEAPEEEADEAPIEEQEAVEEVLAEAAEVEEVEEELDDEAIFAAVDEVVAEAEAAEAVEEVVEEVSAEEEPAESIFDEVAEVAAPAAAAAVATGIAWPDDEVVADEAPAEEVVEEAPAEPEVIEREAEPEEDTYEVECPSCGHVIYVDESVLAQGGIECPKCHENLQFEI
ncbi:MAG: hypothetical protein IJ547_00675, partial [Clostridia bacterium]|nr:hypothetical protein [Clostridia bacterium]